MSTEEYAAFGALAVLFLVVAVLVRRGSRRARRSPAPPTSPDLVPRFEARAQEIARLLLDAGSERLSLIRAGLVPGQEPTIQLLETVRALERKLRELRAGNETDERVHHEWDYLSATTLERYPPLAPWLVELDQPQLVTAAAGQSELLAAVATRLSEQEDQLEAARCALDANPALLWTQLDLVVLTLLQLDCSEAEQRAVTRRLELRPPDRDAADQLRIALAAALDLLHATPRAERVRHDDLLVPALADVQLGAALVRHRIHHACQHDELTRARSLLLGDPDLLWLALAVVEQTEFPEQSATAFGKLAALVRKLLQSGSEDDQTLSDLRAAAGEVFAPEPALALVEAARQLRAGQRHEVLFAAASFGELETP